ncbi:hypothetical protein [Desulfofustis limnaeus]|jgi:hypothetical protein|uniref:hypothetical protein n=1 Tax=Desulfofustis limnaeus TaxID=2740163 RepID=UPI0024E03D08|nr:hypothetical protein [Desulfofustis limnaeus]MDX9895418.1 hypothetical protein [Desulfofustis sp.]
MQRPRCGPQPAKVRAIRKKFGIELPLRAIATSLQCWSFSSPKLPIRACEQKAKKLNQWLEHGSLKIASQTIKEKMEIHRGGEMVVNYEDILQDLIEIEFHLTLFSFNSRYVNEQESNLVLMASPRVSIKQFALNTPLSIIAYCSPTGNAYSRRIRVPFLGWLHTTTFWCSYPLV